MKKARTRQEAEDIVKTGYHIEGTLMSFDRKYPNRKDKRKPYRGSKQFDRGYRNHGGCGLPGTGLNDRSGAPDLKEHTRFR